MQADCSRTVGRCERPRTGLVLEPLERRVLLAGDVTIVVSGGSLVITGDAHDNGLDIQQTWVDEFTVEGLDGTTINGDGSGPIAFAGVTKGIKMKMGAGDDSVALGIMDLPGSVVFTGGDGDDSLQVTGAADGVGGGVVDGGGIGKDLLFKGGAGYDTLLLEGTDVGGNVTIDHGDGGSRTLIGDILGTIYGDVRIKTGLGENLLGISHVTIVGDLKVQHGGSINRTDVEFTQVLGDLSVTGSDGLDYVDLSPVAVGGNLKVDNKNGGSQTTINSEPPGDPVGIPPRGSVLGNLVIRNGFGAGFVIITGMGVSGNLGISQKGGPLQVEVDPVVVAGDLLIRTGDGDDLVELDDLLLFGTASVSLGSGDDELEVGDSWLQDVAVFDGGPGYDRFVDDGGNEFDVGPTVTSFEAFGPEPI